MSPSSISISAVPARPPALEDVVVAADASEPEWVHERNEGFARDLGVPYVRDVEKAIADYDVQVAA